MGKEFDLFAGYPEPKEPRIVGPRVRTIHNRIAASYRDHEFYDGARANGYGGMVDDGRWAPIAKRIVELYEPKCVLQVWAHKGFLLRELSKLGVRVCGTETSEYAIENEVVELTKAPSTRLPFGPKEFDLVIGASCVYSLNLPDAIQCLREIQRVGRRAWVTLAAMENDDDHTGLLFLRHWFLLGTTILTKADWREVMLHAGYTGDYRFDTAKTLNLVAVQ